MNPLLYSAIPEHLLDYTILDLGCGSCESQLQSKNATKFKTASQEGRYLGVDIEPGELLNTVRCDLFTLSTQASFDLVLLIEVAEHIDHARWPELFTLAKNMLAPTGTLIVSVPYREPVGSGMTDPNGVCPHVVFNIDAARLREFLHGASVSYHGRRTIQRRTFRNLITIFIHILRRNQLINPYRPIWILSTWKQEEGSTT